MSDTTDTQTVLFVSHLGVCTSDLDRSRRFYRDVLGFVEVSTISVGAEVGPLVEIPDPALALRSVFLERDGTRIELMGFEGPGVVVPDERRPFNTVGLTHLAVRVADAHAVADAVERCGGTVLHHTWVGEAAAGVELVYVLDPDGVRIELIQVPGDPTVAPGEPVA